MVFSTAIDKYVYVALNRKFDDKIRVSYSVTEVVDNVDDIQHDIVRNTMKRFNMGTGWEIVSIADIPGVGSGLGASSSFVVGLIGAITNHLSPTEVAEIAYDIERNDCKRYCGKQDQYAAAFGGTRLYRFWDDGCVSVSTSLDSKTKKSMEKHLQLFYLGPRKDKDILKRQAHNTADRMEMLGEMARMARDLWDEISIYPCELGQYLDLNWEYKRKLAANISNSQIENIYQKAMKAGANGGKVLGQGGGGFMLFHSDPKYHRSIKDAVGLKEVPFKFTEHRSEVIYGR